MIDLLIIILKLNAASACAAAFYYLAFSSLSVVHISSRKDCDFWVNSQQFVTGKLYPNLRSKSARSALWATVSLILLVTPLKSLPEDQGYIKPIQAEYHSCMLHSDEKPDQAENNNSFCFAAFLRSCKKLSAEEHLMCLIEHFEDLDMSNQRSTSDLMDKNPHLSKEIAKLQHLRTERTSDCVENLENMDTILDLDWLAQCLHSAETSLTLSIRSLEAD